MMKPYEYSKLRELLLNYPLSEVYSICKDKKINIKAEGHYLIFNYDIGADFYDPYVQEARGIIIDIKEKDYPVVCLPFRKFGNYWEGYADKIDWNTATIQEKIDGSIMKLWHSPSGFWQLSTNSCVRAVQAQVANHDMSYADLFEQAINFKDIKAEELNKDYTYIFELVSPYNKIVVNYPITKIYHIGTRNNITGEELYTNIGIDHPKEYSLSKYGLSECIALVNDLCKTEGMKEGFVVVDDKYNRIKVKTTEYLMAHKVHNNGASHKELLELVINDNIPDTIKQVCKVDILYYQYKIAELLEEIKNFVDYAEAIFTESNFNRKELALRIKNMPYASFAFEVLFQNTTVEDIFYNKSINWVVKQIPPRPKRRI